MDIVQNDLATMIAQKPQEIIWKLQDDWARQNNNGFIYNK